MLQKRKSIKLDFYKQDKKIPRSELLKRVKGVDIILSLLTEKIDAEVFDAAGPQLKMVANYAVGFNNVDVEEAKKRGIIVTNTPGDEIGETVAEHAIGFIFALAHRIIEGDDFIRAGKYHGWGPSMLLGTDIVGKTLGIIGTGKIGTHLVQRMADGFGVNILYHDIRRNEYLEKKYNAKYVSKMQLLKKSDFVSLHVPLLDSTHHMISTAEFKAMKKTAFIINTARGPIIDEHAMIKALKRGEIAGAGLDVYECEPLLACNPDDHKDLREMPNVVMTPHTASATVETRQAMSRRAAENILAFLKGKKPANAIK